MEKLHYTIQIDAPREKVWHAMLDDVTYREWTVVFDPSSYYVGDWQKGSKILFLGSDADGKKGGMVSMIEESKPYEFVSIKHLGMIKDGVEDTTSDEVKAWAGGHENYTFKDLGGEGTELIVDIDVHSDFKDQFNDMWPKGLIKLKEIAEKK